MASLNGQSTTNESSRTLLQLGHDAIEKDDNSMINIPLRLANHVYTETALFDFVYPNFLENYSSSTWMLERGILAPRNDNVTRLNDCMLAKIPGNPIIYASTDTTLDYNDAVGYPVNF